MTPRPRALRIGAFALGALAVLVATVATVFGGGLFERRDTVVMHFAGSVWGLKTGAPVVLRGVRVGTVTEVGLAHGELGAGAAGGAGPGFTVPVRAELQRSAIADLRRGGSAAADPALALPALVQRGLSAQLVSQSLLTGLLYVDLDLRPGAGAVALGAPLPAGVVEVPTLPAARSLLDQLEAAELPALARQLAALLADARGLVGAPEWRRALARIDSAAERVASLALRLERRVDPLADGAQRGLARAGDAAASAADAAQRLGRAGDALAAAAGRADTLLAPGSPLLASVQGAGQELQRSAAALRALLHEESPSVQSLQRALDDGARAARALQRLAELLEQQPDALLRGRAAPPTP